MTELLSIFKGFSSKEKFGTLVFLAVLLTTQIVSGSTLVALFASLMGFFYVTLVRKGSRLCYVFGFIQILTYIGISLKAKFYGDVMLNSFNLVMQPIGWYLWTRRGSNGGQVYVRELSFKNFCKVAVVWSIAILLYNWFVLSKLGGNTPFIDAITTVSSITAMILSINAYSDQWRFWIVCNVVSVIMWTLAMFRGEGSAVPMVVMWVAYLVNSLVAKKQWENMEG